MSSRQNILRIRARVYSRTHVKNVDSAPNTAAMAMTVPARDSPSLDGSKPSGR